MNIKRQKFQSGFTLIELVVTVSVLAILLVIAIPSFNEFRDRAALRGAADQVVGFWGDARFEALRRNQFVKVGFMTDATNGMCIGAATTTSKTDDTPCDCFTANGCDITHYPAAGLTGQQEWRNVSNNGLPTLGDTDSDANGVVVIDPKRGNIAQASDVGDILLKGPAGENDYQLNIKIDRNGRAFVCEPAAAGDKLPQYINRRC
ncbi:MAG: pilus assembly FimT family protein [Arenimonas sp.]